MVVLLLFLWTVTLRQTVFNATSIIVIDFSWLTLCLQRNAQKFEKKFAPLNFHKRNESDADFAAIEFGRRGRVIYRTETRKYRFSRMNNLKNSLSYLIAQPTLHWPKKTKQFWASRGRKVLAYSYNLEAFNVPLKGFKGLGDVSSRTHTVDYLCLRGEAVN